jgi:hypothetical protein
MSTQVIVVPPLSSGYVPGFLVARPHPHGIACKDGTFAEHADLGRIVIFKTANEAISWAEGKPRNWIVMNKSMF